MFLVKKTCCSSTLWQILFFLCLYMNQIKKACTRHKLAIFWQAKKILKHFFKEHQKCSVCWSVNTIILLKTNSCSGWIRCKPKKYSKISWFIKVTSGNYSSYTEYWKNTVLEHNIFQYWTLPIALMWNYLRSYENSHTVPSVLKRMYIYAISLTNTTNSPSD